MRLVRCWVVIATLLAPLAAYAQTGTQPAGAPSVKLPEELPPDVAFARQIAFLRADLLMADALVKERDWVDALPHAQFPREEIYGVIRGDLRAYKVPPFDADLRRLAGAIRARKVKSYDRARARVDVALAAADRSLKARQPDWPRFSLRVAVAVLARAAEEYDIAVRDGRIVEAVGYQSARGLVLEADSMIGAAAGKNANELQAARSSLMRLKGIFAPVYAPKVAPVDPATVAALIEDVRRSTARL
jgi:hypothetical protein